MPALVKRTLVFTLLLTLVAITLGSLRSTQPLKSPYVSALNSYTVGTAVAAKPHKCSNTGCLTLQGINSCRGGEYPGTNCVQPAVPSDGLSLDLADPGHRRHH